MTNVILHQKGERKKLIEYVISQHLEETGCTSTKKLLFSSARVVVN